MTHPFAGKKIIFGISGGIAAYKAADWVRALRQEGAEVKVVMTEAATQFVTPLTFAALSGQQVASELFTDKGSETIPHITLAKGCDLLLIAPATANTIARLAHGMADTLLTAITLATKAKVLIFPAMNSVMYQHPATQKNRKLLTELGYTVVEPACGAMACGDHGPGRLVDWATAEATIAASLSCQDLDGQHFLISAGPSQEPLDPVRFISNRSTGTMGYALARAARQRGATVTLVSGPTHLPPPAGVELIPARTALDMRQAILESQAQATVLIMTAAVSDFRPSQTAPLKIKKAGAASVTLDLLANPDILSELGEKKGKATQPMLVGFAAESDHHLQEGQRKLITKNLDLIVINDILGQDTGFASNTNQVTILGRDGHTLSLPLLSKEETAHRLLDHIVKLLAKSSAQQTIT